MDERRLKENFARVAAYGDEVPLFFYSHLFLGHPELREMFPVSMAGQRDRLLNALGRIVSDVSNHEALVPFLQGLGRDHRKFAAMAEHYPAVGTSLLATLAHFSGTAWSEDLARDWTEAYTVLEQVMTEAAARDETSAADARMRGEDILREAKVRASMILEQAHASASQAAASTVSETRGSLPASERQELEAEIAYLRTFSDVCRTHLRAYMESLTRSIAEWERAEREGTMAAARGPAPAPSNGYPQ